MTVINILILTKIMGGTIITHVFNENEELGN